MNSIARVATLVGPGHAEVHDLELEPVGEHDVLLETLYSGISAGTEMNVYSGRAPQWRTRRNPETKLFEPSDEPEWTYPMAYGYAAVSRVAAVESSVTDLKVGALVFSATTHSSAQVVPADSVTALPELSDPRVGVLYANMNTAYNAVLDAHPSLNDTVVVSGLGVVGLLIVQLLARTGARIIGIDSLPSRRKLAERFGAELTYQPGIDVAAAIRDVTENRGADIVIEASGASPALNEAIRIVGYGATVVAISWYSGTFESLSLSGEFHHNRPRIIASHVRGMSREISPLWSIPRRQKLAAAYLTQLDLQPLLTHEFEIENAAAAYKLVESRPDDLIQCLISYRDSDAG